MVTTFTDAQRSLILTLVAQDCPSTLICNDLQTFFGLTVKEPDIKRFRRRDFLSPPDRQIYDAAFEKYQESPDRLRWSVRERHAAALAWWMDDAVERKDINQFLTVSREIRQIQTEIGGSNSAGGGYPDLIEWIVRPVPPKSE